MKPTRWVVQLIYLALLGSIGCATVKTQDDMANWEIAALEESQSRIETYRQFIKIIDSGHSNLVAKSADAQEAKRKLTALIADEIDFQGAVIRQDPAVRIHASLLLDKIYDAAGCTPALLGGIAICALRMLPQILAAGVRIR